VTEPIVDQRRETDSPFEEPAIMNGYPLEPEEAQAVDDVLKSYRLRSKHRSDMQKFEITMDEGQQDRD
jgi:hypothetical protein